MKKLCLALAALVALTQVSCVKDESTYFHITDVKGVVINEVYTFSDQSEATDLDWIELYNTTAADIDLTDVIMWEGGGAEEAWAFPKGSIIPANGYFVVECDKYGLLNNPKKYPAWGLSKGPEEVIVLANSDQKIIDEIALPSMNENETYGRVSDGDKEWKIFKNGTKGAKNEGPGRDEFENTTGLFINEVYHDNSDDFVADGWDASLDFIEFYNANSTDYDLSGHSIYDDKHEEETKFVFPEGTIVPAKGFYVIDVDKDDPSNPSFGLGAGGDWLFLYNKAGEKVEELEIPAFSKESGLRDHGYTFGRKPDGSLNLVIFAEATKGSSNNNAPVLEGSGTEPEPEPEPGQPSTGAAKVVFNELCGNKVEWGGNPANKFIELYNAGEGDGNLAGWTIRKYAADATDVAGKYNVVWVGPEGTTIAAGAYIVLGADATDYADGFTAGLSAKKGVKFELVDAAGNVVDRFIRGEDADPFGEEGLSENKEASYSRVPNGTGSFAYAVPTPGAANGESTGEIENEPQA